MSTPHKPLVILQADPHPKERIFTPDALARLDDRFTVVEPDSEEAFDKALPDAFAVVGQPDLPAERLARAGELRALLNVEGNFFRTSTTKGVSGAASTSWAADRPTPRPSPSTPSGSRSTWRAASAARTAPSAPGANGTCPTATPTPYCCAARTSA